MFTMALLAIALLSSLLAIPLLSMPLLYPNLTTFFVRILRA